MDSDSNISRRRVLAGIGSGGAVTVLAGCSGPETTDSSPEETDSTAEDSGMNSTETETETETATGTPTRTPPAPEDNVSDGVMETIRDFQYVVVNREDFFGEEVTFPEAKYTQDRDGNSLFRMQYEKRRVVHVDKETSSIPDVESQGEDTIYRIVGDLFNVTELPTMFIENAEVTIVSSDETS